MPGKKLLKLFKNNKRKESNINNSKSDKPATIAKSLDKNIKNILNELGNSSDIVLRKIVIGKDKPINAAIIYTDGLVNITNINDFLKVLFTGFPEHQSNSPIMEIIENKILNVGEVKKSNNINELINYILTGLTVLLVDNSDTALIANTMGWESSAISEPQNQQIIRGPRTSFNENIRTNTALIRRYLSTSKLRLEQMKVGKLSETTVGIMYIEGIANKKIVDEVKYRISKVDIDVLLGIGILEELIRDNNLTWFPLTAYTERPDTVAGNLVEGKVIILVDGNPFVMTAPATFFMFFQSADDYYLTYQVSSMLRLLRYFTFFISISFPALYVSVTTFNPELLPTTILITLAAQREGVPFPTFLETFLMVLAFEILREGGIRMPKPMGQTISIVGALVLGTAAVDAGIISAAVVIIVSVTAISDFTSPYTEMSNAVRIARIIWLFFATIFGLFGVLFALILSTIHLVSLRSYGIPYLTGIAPFNISDQKDLLIRAPWPFMKNRPHLSTKQNFIRQGENTTPKPPKDRQ